MTVRQAIKRWLYGSCPGIAGAFPYFGVRVHFPRRSIIFEAACGQGIYEQHNLQAMLAFARAGSVVLDVGANIGLMTVPVLASRPEVRVVSFEASPGTLAYLSKTRAGCAYANRWEIVPKAAGREAGTAAFSVSAPASGAYDGLRSTQRAEPEKVITVEVTTVDAEWRRLKCPEVSVIKIDVEGGEYDVLLGAADCIARCQPAVVLEWGQRNFEAYGRSMGDLLAIARKLGYRVWALPYFAEVADPAALRLYASVTESFLLFADAAE